MLVPCWEASFVMMYKLLLALWHAGSLLESKFSHDVQATFDTLVIKDRVGVEGFFPELCIFFSHIFFILGSLG